MHDPDDPFCNCEDCWWANDQHEICSVCGCLVGLGCPCELPDNTTENDNTVKSTPNMED